MNNNGQPTGAVAGLTALVGGTGITCTPNPITRTGIVSLSPVITSTIAETANKVQNVESTETNTRINGSFQVNDFNVDPFIVIDPTASLAVHGPTVSVSNLQPISNEADIGTSALPFYRLYAINVECDNVITPSSNLNALTTTVSNHTSMIMDLSNTTQNINATADVTNFTGQVNAGQFVKDGGTSNQFLMADGSVTENSNSNANSNIYLYRSSVITSAPPSSGEVRFNAPTNAASSILCLNHLTRDGTDIHAFLSLITTLSVIYIQEESNAENYIKFNVNTKPTLPEPHVFIQLDVTFTEGGGTGLTSFGPDTNIFVSIFSNDREIDERLSLVEGRTRNINSFATQTIFGGLVNMGNNRITNLPYTPVGEGDAASVAWVLGQIGAFITEADAAGEFLSLADATLNYALISSLANYLTKSEALSTYLTQASAANTYATLTSQNIARQAKQLTFVTTNGLLETIMNTTPTFGSYTWTDTVVGQSRKWKIHGVQTRSNFSATYTIKFKSNGNLNITWVLPATPSQAVNGQPFTLEIVQVRQLTNSLYYYAKFSSPDATTAGYSLYTSQNQSGGVVGLNVSSAYTITVQSSLASATLTFQHVDVTAVLG